MGRKIQANIYLYDIRIKRNRKRFSIETKNHVMFAVETVKCIIGIGSDGGEIFSIVQSSESALNWEYWNEKVKKQFHHIAYFICNKHSWGFFLLILAQ